MNHTKQADIPTVLSKYGNIICEYYDKDFVIDCKIYETWKNIQTVFYQEKNWKATSAQVIFALDVVKYRLSDITTISRRDARTLILTFLGSDFLDEQK